MATDLPPSRTADQFVVRLPDGMRDRIAEAAAANKRSMNAEIVARLEDSFRERGNQGNSDMFLFILLDAAGRIVGWDDIAAALSEVAKTMKVRYPSVSVRVVSPGYRDMMDTAMDEYMGTSVDELRRGGASRVIASSQSPNAGAVHESPARYSTRKTGRKAP